MALTQEAIYEAVSFVTAAVSQDEPLLLSIESEIDSADLAQALIILVGALAIEGSSRAGCEPLDLVQAAAVKLSAVEGEPEAP